jgi:phage gp36-like protein
MAQAFATSANMALLGLPQVALDRAEVKAPGCVAMALSAANGRAEGALAAGGYILPLVSWGDDLRERVCALAAFSIMCVMGYNPDSEADQAVLVRYRDAVAWFESLASGELPLAGVVESPPPAEEVTADGAAAVYTDARRGW